MQRSTSSITKNPNLIMYRGIFGSWGSTSSDGLTGWAANTSPVNNNNEQAKDGTEATHDEVDHASTITASELGAVYPNVQSRLAGVEGGKEEWECSPYKVEFFERQLFQNEPGTTRRTAVIETLRKLGIKVFVIEALSVKNNRDVVEHVEHVVDWVAQDNTMSIDNRPLGFQRCLLYQDEEGRLFNLVLSSHRIGPAMKWREYFQCFSCRKALAAFVILCRSIPGILQIEDPENIRPLYLALIVAMVLSEETSLSEMSSSMLVRAVPSVSAYVLTAPIQADVVRKITILLLVFAAATTGITHAALSGIGLLGVCLTLLVNLGSRSWHFLRLKPLKYHARGSFFVAYLMAAAAGFALPFLANRKAMIGGKAAMEHMIVTAIVVGGVMILSDYESFREVLVIGSEPTNQDIVNLLMGCWWTISFLCCLCLARPNNYSNEKPENGERLLIEDAASPVGFKVPSLPDYEIDPGLADRTSRILSPHLYLITGFVLAIAVGGWLVLVAFTNWGNDLYEDIKGSV